MASGPIAREHIQHALSTLRQDEPPSSDLPSGQFYERDGWLDGLPRDTQSFICAVQRAGDHPDRPLFCSNMGAQHLAKWKQSKRTEELESALAIYLVAVRYTRPEDPRRADRLSDFAFAYQAKWEQTKSVGDLDIAVHFFRRAVIAAEPSHPALAAFRTNLAYILKQRWNSSKSVEHRQEAADNFLRAIELAADHPHLPQMLSNYGEFVRLTTTSGDTFRIKLLTEAAETQDRAVKLLRPFMQVPHGTIWRNAAIAHHTLFKITFDKNSSIRAIEYYKESVDLTPQTDPQFSAWRTEFAEHYTLRYQTWGHLDDIRESLRLYDEVLEVQTKSFSATIGKADVLRILADREKDVATSRYNLIEACKLADKSIEFIAEKSNSRGWAYFRTSAIYSCRYEMDGDSRYLDKAIELSRLSLKYTEHEAFWDFGRWRAEVCLSRHVKNGFDDDLTQAFTAVRAAIETLDEWDLTNLASCYVILGKCYMSQYNCGGELKDLNEALTWLNAACVPGTGREHTLALTQNDVANALCSKFRQTYSRKDLDRAIEHYALSIKNLGKSNIPANHKDYAMLQNGMGQAMLQRYLHWGSQDDLTFAIDSFRESLKKTDTHSPRLAGRACNLSYSLQLMFALRPEMSLLKEAQSQLLDVLNSSGDYGNNLLQLLHCHMGNIYLKGYEITQDALDLVRAIDSYQRVLTFSGGDRRYRADVTMNIAVALHKRALRSGRPQDYTDSIATSDAAVGLNLSNASQLLMTRLNRAETYRDLYEKFDDIQYGRKALLDFSEVAATPNARTDIILRAAEAASDLEVSVNHDYCAAFTQIQKAIEIFPQTVLFLSNRLEQLRIVRKHHFLPGSATALAVGAGRPGSQILFSLENIRAFIWNRFLISSMPLDALREKCPELADEFETLRGAMVSQSTADPNSSVAGVLPTKDQLRLEKHAKTDAYAKLLHRIQEQKGFEDVLPFFDGEKILVESLDAPIVYLNISSYRCDAILWTSKGVRTLSLHELNIEDVKNQAFRLYEAQMLVEKEFARACAKFEEVMLWLWLTTAKPILEDLEQDYPIAMKAGKQRIYWVSSGWLSIIPIHAAGDWTPSRQNESCPSVHERFVSSYVPSLGVLKFMRMRADYLKVNNTTSTALLVGMPHTPDMPEDSDLDAEAEALQIKKIVENDLPTQVLLSPGLNEVISALGTCQLAHFACHGCADSHDPSKSALRLADWMDRPLNVRTLLNLKPANCQLAFLSACETAASKDLLLRDEGLHVAGAFNMAGVPHTVAGMWKVKDSASVELVKAFYTELFATEGRLRYQGTAMALHAAVSHLRDTEFHPILWGAFVHMGP